MPLRLCSVDTPDQQKIETPEQLLTAVNAALKEMHRPAYTMKELTVCLVEQASASRNEGELQPRVGALLEAMRKGKKFEFPVDVICPENDSIRLSSENRKFLKLPPYVSLYVRVLNVPWGSVDRDGKRLKVVWSTVLIATAVKETKTR